MLLDAIQRRMSRRELADGPAVAAALRSGIRELLAPCEAPLHPDPTIKPYVILAVGVNGAGKTTTLAKLAAQLNRTAGGYCWPPPTRSAPPPSNSCRAGVTGSISPVIAQHTGADAAAVAHDAIAAARARNVDVLIVDTAGRQHTHRGLMDELRKIRRVLDKAMPGAPHEVLMVLDAGTGQNALSQLKHFHEAVNVTGLVVTKLDGTARAAC